jgi:DNA-binding NtrC family response regulator
MTAKLLIVEDDDSLREVISDVLSAKGYQVAAVGSVDPALNLLKEQQFDLVLSDFKLPGKNGIDLLREIRALTLKVPFVLMTAYGSTAMAVEAMKEGANDFITKPFEPEGLSGLIAEVIAHKRVLDRTRGSRQHRERLFLGEHPSIKGVLEDAKKVARFESSVLILGESGTGKELLARYIHDHSSRADKPFVAINCAALPPALLESEFFGHEAGAFTGATQARKGLLEVASEGTIFLDEIGDMPPLLQVKLLRALQEREITRVGGTEPITINPRVLSATNINIEAGLADGKMREDFYYRIAVITLEIPPLRARKSDIELLTKHYVSYFCSQIGKSTLKIEETAKEILTRYKWPGNARELENVVERAVILANGQIGPDDLGINLKLDFDSLDDARLTLADIAASAAQRAEKDAISKALERSSGNKVRAARLLGVSYKTLLNKVKEYQLSAE